MTSEGRSVEVEAKLAEVCDWRSVLVEIDPEIISRSRRLLPDSRKASILSFRYLSWRVTVMASSVSSRHKSLAILSLSSSHCTFPKRPAISFGRMRVYGVRS
jgi:hypothetical protein